MLLLCVFTSRFTSIYLKSTINILKLNKVFKIQFFLATAKMVLGWWVGVAERDIFLLVFRFL